MKTQNFIHFTHFIRFIIITAASFTLLACASFVKLDPGAASIRVITIEQATMCTLVGEVLVEVLPKVGSIKRKSEKTAEDAQSLARNSALGFEANSIAPLDEISAEGKQTYGMYDCKR